MGDTDTDVQYLKQLVVHLLNEMVVGSPDVIMNRLKTILEPPALLRRMTWLYQEFLERHQSDLGARLVPITNPTTDTAPPTKSMDGVEEGESAVGEYTHSVFGAPIEAKSNTLRHRYHYDITTA